MRKFAAILALALMLVTSGTALAASAFPKSIPLPNGFQPEGIVSGAGTDFYAGSLANGAIYKGDLRTGQGAVLISGRSRAGSRRAGLRRAQRLPVCVGRDGRGRDRCTIHARASLVASFQFAPANSSFINDVIVTRQAAYFTDSFNARLFVVPLGPGGAVEEANGYQVLPLSGDWAQVPGHLSLMPTASRLHQTAMP